VESNKTYRVLLVEDDEDDYITIRDYLREVKESQLALEWAPSYERGLALLLEGRFDICLVDYRLGGSTGVDLLREALAANVLIPIILLTGYGDQEIEREAMRIGAADFLVKGEISAPLLERAIRYAIHRAQTQAQVLRQDRLASVGLLASSLAHEIGTPLGVIRGRAEYTLMQVDNREAVSKNLGIIISEIDRISKLIQSLLSLARGGGAGTSSMIELRPVVEDVLALMGHEFRKYNIAIDNRLEQDVPVPVRAESDALRQVVLNLLVNAVHAIQVAAAAGREDPCIEISASDEIEFQALSFRDTGCGISPVHMQKLFKPFFTTKDIGVGTGLGLATSYNILKSWGGDIRVESEEGVGTRFTLLIPKA
jgi:signal transduction histidine kinase